MPGRTALRLRWTDLPATPRFTRLHGNLDRPLRGGSVTDARSRAGRRPDLLSRGRLWIEPASGRVLMSEMITENDDVRGQINISYQSEPLLGLLVPIEMRERYTGSGIQRDRRSGDVRKIPGVSGAGRRKDRLRFGDGGSKAGLRCRASPKSRIAAPWKGEARVEKPVRCSIILTHLPSFSPPGPERTRLTFSPNHRNGAR